MGSPCINTLKSKIALAVLLIAVSCGQQTTHPMVGKTVSHRTPLESDHFANASLLHLLHSGDTKAAVEKYFDSYGSVHNSTLIRKMAFHFLEEGCKSRELNEQLCAIYGAGITGDSLTIPLLTHGLNGYYEEVQHAALTFLASLQDETATEVIRRNGISSSYLTTRLATLFHLAEVHHPLAAFLIESMMYKLTPNIRNFFPHLLALEGSKTSIDTLSQLCKDENAHVCNEAIISAAQFERDDLLPSIRSSLHNGILYEEASAWALGMLGDSKSSGELLSLLDHSPDNVKLAALLALTKMGHKEHEYLLDDLARKGNLFAIATSENEQLLLSLIDHDTREVRANASFALLHLRHPACLPGIQELLLPTTAHRIPSLLFSPGKTQHAIGMIHPPSDPKIRELSLQLQENIVKDAAALAEESFLALCRSLLSPPIAQLVPACIHALEHLQSPRAIELLGELQQQPGAPFVRHYCALALYRLTRSKRYKQEIASLLPFLSRHPIHFRPPASQRRHTESHSFELTPEERSRLLIESLETIGNDCSSKGISLLLQTLANCDNNNKFIIAGYLIKSVQ